MLTFISSNKWFRANYGKKLREHIAKSTSVLSITDFGDLPVFTSATAYPMIFIARKDGKSAATRYTQVPSLAPPYPDVRAVIERHGHTLSANAIEGADWTLADGATASRLRGMRATGIPLGEYVNQQIYYGVKTGFNTAFVIDGAKRAELIAADPKSAEIIRPLAVGRDIRKWCIDYKDRWLIVTKIGVDINRYPAIFAHLSQWQQQLEVRRDQGNHWWELRACAYYAVFDQPKIVYQEIATYSAFALDLQGSYVNNKVFLIAVHDLYLLGVLNSTPIWEFLRTTCSGLSGGALAMQTPYITKVPIPGASPVDRTAIADLVQRCLRANGQGPEVAEWEAEINARVAKLYGVE